ncbi:MAG: hypothetical protein HYX24_02925 [Candidatus Aenigmarchaeota archaeon]|nr:hypothetical protein [Candidatus Aenigmarchaeota archaeon]
MGNRKWYRIDAVFGHGVNTTVDLYVYARDALAALTTYKHFPGIKKHKFPNIIQITDEEALQLEQKIIEECYPLRKTKSNGYLPGFLDL